MATQQKKYMEITRTQMEKLAEIYQSLKKEEMSEAHFSFLVDNFPSELIEFQIEVQKMFPLLNASVKSLKNNIFKTLFCNNIIAFAFVRKIMAKRTIEYLTELGYEQTEVDKMEKENFFNSNEIAFFDFDKCEVTIKTLGNKFEATEVFNFITNEET